MTRGCRPVRFPFSELAKDIVPDTLLPESGIASMTLARDLRRKEQVSSVVARADRAGATIVKPALEEFRSGHSRFLTDLDGYLWEVAWGPVVMFDGQNDLCFASDD